MRLMLGLLMNVHEAPQRGWSRSRDPRSSWIARTAVRVGAQPFATVRRRERRATFGIEIRLGLTDRADDIQPQRRARKNAPPRDSSTTANANVAIAATVRRAAAPTRRHRSHASPSASSATRVVLDDRQLGEMVELHRGAKHPPRRRHEAELDLTAAAVGHGCRGFPTTRG